MPTNVVKTSKQEELWNKAKILASKEGKGKNYAYIMSIFKNMGGLKEANKYEDSVEKLGGFIGRLLGSNVRQVGKKVSRMEGNIERATNRLRGEQIQKGFKGKIGPFSYDTTRSVPKYSDKAIKAKLSGKYDRLEALKRLQNMEKSKTFKTRAKTTLGAGALGVGGTALYNRNKNPDTENYSFASKYDESIEKIAGNVFRSFLDIATAKGFRDASKNLKNLDNMKNTNIQEITRLQNLRKDIEKLQTKNDKITKAVKMHSGEDTQNIEKVLKGALNRKTSSPKPPKSKFRNNKNIDENTFSNFKKKLDTLRNSSQYNEKVINSATQKYNEGRKAFVNKRDNELAKTLGLYGVGATGAGVGLYQGVKKMKNKEQT